MSRNKNKASNHRSKNMFKKIQLTVAKYYQWLEKQAKISNE